MQNLKKCLLLKAQWQELEAAEKVNPSFVKYFEKNKEEDIFDHMRVNVDGGFGNQIVTTNPIESLNAVIKRWNNFNATDASTFLEDIKACIDDQNDNVRKAFLDLPSPFTVRPEFREKVAEDYHGLDSEGRKCVLCEIQKLKIDVKRFNEVKKYKPGVKSSLCLSMDEENREPSAVANDPFQCLLTILTRTDIDLLRKKAERIIENKEIIQGFSEKHLIVKSASGSYRTVTLIANNKICCEKGCLGYDTRSICVHTIATALFTNTLMQYTKKFSPSVNLTRMTIPAALNKNAGKEGSTRKRQRAGSPQPVKKFTIDSW